MARLRLKLELRLKLKLRLMLQPASGWTWRLQLAPALSRLILKARLGRLMLIAMHLARQMRRQAMPAKDLPALYLRSGLELKFPLLV
jgi:hypothetical protein